MKSYLALLAIIVAGPAISGPFGLEMGMTIEQIKKITDATQAEVGVYRATAVPNGHPDIEQYALVVMPQHGLCKILASTKSVETNGYGTQLHAKFDDMEAALTKKYGTGKRYDYLRSGSLWKEPQYWMMGLEKKDRELAAVWGLDKQTLPDNLDAISLQAKARSTGSGMLVLTYEFKNAHDCIEARKNSQNSSL